MNTRDKLINRGYPIHAAEVTTSKLNSLTGVYAQARDKWLEDSHETDMESHGYTISGLMQRFKGMTYPAALLSIEWIDREPEKAIFFIEKGIR